MAHVLLYCTSCCRTPCCRIAQCWRAQRRRPQHRRACWARAAHSPEAAVQRWVVLGPIYASNCRAPAVPYTPAGAHSTCIITYPVAAVIASDSHLRTACVLSRLVMCPHAPVVCSAADADDNPAAGAMRAGGRGLQQQVCCMIRLRFFSTVCRLVPAVSKALCCLCFCSTANSFVVTCRLLTWHSSCILARWRQGMACPGYGVAFTVCMPHMPTDSGFLLGLCFATPNARCCCLLSQEGPSCCATQFDQAGAPAGAASSSHGGMWSRESDGNGESVLC